MGELWNWADWGDVDGGLFLLMEEIGLIVVLCLASVEWFSAGCEKKL